jgi:hypothetical protein
MGNELTKRASSASVDSVGNCTTPMTKKARFAIMDEPLKVKKESILSMYGNVFEVKDADEKSAEEIISSQEVNSLPPTPVRRLTTKTSPLSTRVVLDVQGCINAGEHCMQRVRGGRVEKAKMTREENGLLVAQYEYECFALKLCFAREFCITNFPRRVRRTSSLASICQNIHNDIHCAAAHLAQSFLSF